MTPKRKAVAELTGAVEHELAVEYVPIDDLTEHPENPRKGRVDVIEESLNRTGQYKPIVVSRATGYVVAGNHTLKAARNLRARYESGEAAEGSVRLINALAVVYLDNLTPDAERRILAIDNRSADMGTYDDEALLELLRSLEDLTATGYTDTDLDDLVYVLEGAIVVHNPTTDAHDNETDEQRAEREARVGNYQSLASQGKQEMILVLRTDQKDQAVAWIEKLRQAWNPDWSNGEVVHAALSRVVEQL